MGEQRGWLDDKWQSVKANDWLVNITYSSNRLKNFRKYEAFVVSLALVMDQSSEKEKNRPNFIARDELACQSTKTSSHACFTKKKIWSYQYQIFWTVHAYKSKFHFNFSHFPKERCHRTEFLVEQRFFPKSCLNRRIGSKLLCRKNNLILKFLDLCLSPSACLKKLLFF